MLTQKNHVQSLSINPRNTDAETNDRTLNIDNQEIKKTEQIKLLGVYIDENLNFADHISDLCTYLEIMLNILSNLGAKTI